MLTFCNLRLIFQHKITIPRNKITSFLDKTVHDSPRKNMSSWETEKTKFSEMSFEEKRQFYKTKKYTTLDQVHSWKDYYQSNKERLQKLIAQYGPKEQDFSPDLELSSIVSIWQGDITELEIDAIVNAANSRLLGGGGVDGAIHRAAGPLLKQECATLKGCPTGEAKITGGYLLPAKFVIHTVGPQGEKPDLLRNCYNNSLKNLVNNQLTSVAFPCISTGIYGYPADKAAHVALQTVRKFLLDNKSSIHKVIFTLFLDTDVEIYETLMQIYFPTE